jgi:hypothetical protein
MRQPAAPITRAAWVTFKVQPEPFNESERVCPHHGFSREHIVIDPVLDCEDCFSGLLKPISLSSLVGPLPAGEFVCVTMVRPKKRLQKTGALLFSELRKRVPLLRALAPPELSTLYFALAHPLCGEGLR